MKDRSHILTEQRLPQSMRLDRMSVAQAVALMNAQDARAIAAAASQRRAVARAVRLVAVALGKGGRLFYVGAGSSGRLGVLDAAECPPTFRTDPRMVQGIIAGGKRAMFRSQEGVEDSRRAGAAQMDMRRVGPGDVVLGIAAGGTTPFVHGALRRARHRRAKTIFLSCARRVAGEPRVDVIIRPLTGPEVVTGSTRLKAGTATKIMLNTISTLAMVRIGKVYENLMVDLRASNQKLKDRATRIVMELTGLPRPRAAAALLNRADGHVKLAIVMHRHRLPPAAARRHLRRQREHLRRALAGLRGAPTVVRGNKG